MRKSLSYEDRHKVKQGNLAENNSSTLAGSQNTINLTKQVMNDL